MKNTAQLLKSLEKLGYIIETSRGGSSTIKIRPPDKNLPFYTFHNGEKGLHPLRRFAKKHWNLDITNI
jgi:hypothetical protein